MGDKRKAARLGGIAVVVLFGGGFLALLLPDVEVEVVAAAFVGFVVCTARALAIFHADDLVFDSNARFHDSERAARSAVHAGLAAGTIGALALGRAAAARVARSPRRGSRSSPTFPRSLTAAPLPKTR
jgi:hypothetical protein